MRRYNAFNRARTGRSLTPFFARTNVRRRTRARPVERLPQTAGRRVIDRDSPFASPRPSAPARSALALHIPI
jgi:hypothetical protein